MCNCFYKAFLIAVFVCYSVVVYAQDDSVTPATDEKNEYVKNSGIISDSGGRNVKVDGLWENVENIGSVDRMPISSVLSQVRSNEWSMKLTNNSQDKIKLLVSFLQYNSRGKIVKTSTYSYIIGANQFVERKVRTSASTTRCAVMLKSWNKVERQSQDDELETFSDEKQVDSENIQE